MTILGNVCTTSSNSREGLVCRLFLGWEFDCRIVDVRIVHTPASEVRWM